MTPPAGSTTICTDELGPVVPRTFPPARGWSADGQRIKAPLDYERGPEKTWVYGALRVRDGKELIPTCVLTSKPKMGKIGHRSKALRVGLKLLDPVTDPVYHLIECSQCQIWKLFFTQVLPEVFYRIEFWTVGWLRDQADIVWDDEILGLMPAGSIHLHHDKILGEGLADMLQEELHHGRIGRRQHQSRHFPLGWRHGGIDVGVFSHYLAWSTGPDSSRCPGPSGNAHPFKAALIFGHLQDWSLVVWAARGEDGLDRLLEVF